MSRAQSIIDKFSKNETSNEIDFNIENFIKESQKLLDEEIEFDEKDNSQAIEQIKKKKEMLQAQIDSAEEQRRKGNELLDKEMEKENPDKSKVKNIKDKLKKLSLMIGDLSDKKSKLHSKMMDLQGKD